MLCSAPPVTVECVKNSTLVLASALAIGEQPLQGIDHRGWIDVEAGR
jgi:hypothetical protein